VILTTQPKIDFTDKLDGTGFNLCASHSGHHTQLQIGNVSVAFDDRNEFRGQDDYSGYVIQLIELQDDPVRLNNQSVLPRPDVAEMLMRAIAADLGFSVEPVNPLSSKESS